MDSSTGNFITHDEKATRLWNLKKMLKSTRIERKEDNKFLELLCLDRIERILVIFTPKASVSEKGGSIQILSLNLARIQSVSIMFLLMQLYPFLLLNNISVKSFLQIKLDYYSISRFSISPSQTEVLLVGKISVFGPSLLLVDTHLDALPIAQQTRTVQCIRCTSNSC